MEPFFDFGFFELLAVIGLAAVARTIYSSKVVGISFLITSAVAPGVLLVLVNGAKLRWSAGISLATALVNVALIAAVLQSGHIPQLKVPSWIRRQTTSASNSDSDPGRI